MVVEQLKAAATASGKSGKQNKACRSNAAKNGSPSNPDGTTATEPGNNDGSAVGTEMATREENLVAEELSDSFQTQRLSSCRGRNFCLRPLPCELFE